MITEFKNRNPLFEGNWGKLTYLHSADHEREVEAEQLSFIDNLSPAA